MSENTSDPDRIERDLDRTRARLDSRLTELQDRFSPGQVVDDLMAYFRGSGGAEFGQNLLDSVRSNPIPAVVAGVGLAWLMASSPRPRTGSAATSIGASPTAPRGRVRVSDEAAAPGSYDLLTARVRGSEQAVVRRHDEDEQAFEDRLNDARGQAMGLVREAQETAKAFAQRIQAAVSAAATSASHASASVSQAVTQGGQDLRDRAADALDQASGAVQQASRHAGDQFAQGTQAVQRVGGTLVAALGDSPVLLGVIGLAAGALLGALVPQSDQEESALGAAAGQARQAARDLAQRTVDRGGHVVEAVLQAGRQSVSDHGLSGVTSLDGIVQAAKSGDLAGNAAQVARDMLGAADQAVRKEGLGGS